MPFDDILLTALIFIAAVLYSSVGHGGASGYIAAMALTGVSATVMKPSALALNILVATVATTKYYRVGAFSWPLFWPFAIASVPFAYLGGMLTLPGHIYKPLVGAVLLYTAWRSFRTAQQPPQSIQPRPPMPWLLSSGAGLGLLSGLTGVGGGIFLSPLLLFLRCADVKVISGTAAAFILVNSVAGLAGAMASAPSLPTALPFWAAAAVVGGFIGSEFGSKRLGNPTIQKILAVVLAIAGIKMIATA